MRNENYILTTDCVGGNSNMIKKFSLSDHGNSLEKGWYILYYIKNKAGRVCTKKVYGGINRSNTVEGRHAAAKKLIAQLEKMETDVYVPQFKYTSLHNAYRNVLEGIRPRLRRKSYLTYLSKVEIFLSWCDSEKIKKLESLNKEICNKFLNYLIDTEQQGRSTRTFNAYRSTLDSLTKRMDNKDFKSPWAEIKNLKKESVPAMFFQKHQITVLRNKISKDNPQLWLFCQFIYYCLIRPGELRMLKIGDINFQDGTIYIRSDISKNKKNDYVAIPDEFLEVLMELRLYEQPEDFYIFGSGGVPSDILRRKDHFSKKHFAILKELKFNTIRYKLYSWKHTGAVFLVKNGASMKDIQMQGRWASLDQVNEYLRSMGVHDMTNLKSCHKM